ncbi:hypothetical protein K8I31_13940 [bacterium]|nr:hypothetical protein [bacterium]
MDATKNNPLLDIVKRLRIRNQLNDALTDSLDDMAGSVRKNAGLFDKPDEVQDFIHKFREYMQSYSAIIKKILQQIEDEITEEHIHSLRNIANRNDVELQRCFQFQRYVIARGANDHQAEPVLQNVYTSIRDRIETDKDLGALIADMMRFAKRNEVGEHVEEEVHHTSHEPKSALRSKSPDDESVGERAYKLVILFFIKTNIGRAIALLAFICIGVSFTMNYTQKGPGMIDAISNSDFEKDAASIESNSEYKPDSNSALNVDASPEVIDNPTNEVIVPQKP